MPRRLKRTPLELGLDLNINHLIREGFLQPSKITQLRAFHWKDDDGDITADACISADMTGNVTADIKFRYGVMRIIAGWINETVQLIARPRHFGGEQWYFVCPRDNQDVSVLWSPPGQRFFAGRTSWGERYAYLSQYYGRGARAHYMVGKLCDRIGGPGASYEWEIPPKPKWMRWRTYERLSKKCEKYCEEATTLPVKHVIIGDII
jgi:hypothetical protein